MHKSEREKNWYQHCEVNTKGNTSHYHKVSENISLLSINKMTLWPIHCTMKPCQKYNLEVKYIRNSIAVIATITHNMKKCWLRVPLKTSIKDFKILIFATKRRQIRLRKYSKYIKCFRTLSVSHTTGYSKSISVVEVFRWMIYFEGTFDAKIIWFNSARLFFLIWEASKRLVYKNRPMN